MNIKIEINIDRELLLEHIPELSTKRSTEILREIKQNSGYVKSIVLTNILSHYKELERGGNKDNEV